MKHEKAKKFFTSKSGRSIVIVTSVLLIGLAVYLNYRWFYDPLTAVGYGDNNMSDRYGDTAAASTDTAKTTETDYFSATALAREKAREEAVDVLKLTAEGEGTDAAGRAAANAKIAQIAQDIQNEANIESLVKAKGYESCVAVISDGAASVIVKADALTASRAAQIFSIVYETTGISPENVSVINR